MGLGIRTGVRIPRPWDQIVHKKICPLSESLALHVRIPRPIVLYTVYGLSLYRDPCDQIVRKKIVR